MSIAALILAAGASSRMGTNKALLEYRGRTFLENIIDTLRDAAVDCAVVAIRAGDDKIFRKLDLDGVHVVRNAAPIAAGQIESLRLGLTVIVNQMVESAIVWPVDIPHVHRDTITKLKATSQERRAAITIPVFRGVRGHPVVFAKSVFAELLQAPVELGARSVVRRDPDRVVQVPVLDAAVIDDIDTPEDYARLISSTKSLP